MACTRSSDIGIPLFDGSDYFNWKVRMMKFLQFKKCKDVVQRKVSENDDVEKWEEKDIQATNYIYGTITNKQLEYIHECETAFDIITKFDAMYLKTSTSVQIVCRNNLECVKLKNYPDVNIFFNDFEKYVNELKHAGATVTEQEKLNYMLRALPSNYSHIGDLIDVLPEKDRTVDYLKSKIKSKLLEEKNDYKDCAPAEKSNAFKIETSKLGPQGNVCYNC
ncbi:uncharacterized protein LOC118198870 [Stegodyphus dumicola]|uniref:uncharacterized protein LOC118198870 n=1 Tax=Stegodyphus dumicola TaxID=202533 RepID=UPI0015B2A6E7|nr:uncharacterized protein LOC118198870 [Stegodyphus dumicola]